MSRTDDVVVTRVSTAEQRAKALAVLAATYRDEKAWVTDVGGHLPPEDLRRHEVSWFFACTAGQPVGVLRVLYDPPLHLYREYGLELLDHRLDVDAFLHSHRIAEVGRFAVHPAERRSSAVALALIREAIAETVRRGFSHYVTDVFEDDEHSPYLFHTRVLGFEPVATHLVGELDCPSRRITLLLDLRSCYQRLRVSNGYFYRAITERWDAELHARLAAPVALPPQFAAAEQAVALAE